VLEHQVKDYGANKRILESFSKYGEAQPSILIIFSHLEQRNTYINLVYFFITIRMVNLP
jgi:hypothetical protein